MPLMPLIFLAYLHTSLTRVLSTFSITNHRVGDTSAVINVARGVINVGNLDLHQAGR